MAPGGYPVRVEPMRLRLSVHAAARYRERIRPTLETPQVIAELERLLPAAEFGVERPAWASLREEDCGWVLLTPEIAFPVVQDTLVTCVERGGVGASVRILTKKSRDGRRDNAPARGRRKKHGKVARAERRRRDREREEASDGT